MAAIAPGEVRYIKLGAGGRWATLSFEKGEMHFSHASVPHALCVEGDWEKVTRFLVDSDGRSLGKARDATREIREFYTLDTDCLWITFADSHLWWAFADPEVIWLGSSTEQHGTPAALARFRHALDDS